MAPPLFRLIQANGLFFIALGLLIALCPHMPAQAAFFLGPTIPLPLPWVPAPFHAFMTQKGLEESWSTILNVCRALGSVMILFGAALLMQGSELMREYHSQMEYLAKRGKRGETVHAKVSAYETQIGAARVHYNPPPLWLLVLVHIGVACGAQYACQNKVLGPTLEITTWFANLVSAVHAVMALESFACWLQARSLWAKRDSKPVAVKAE